MGGLYLASLMAESLVAATYTLPSDIERLAGQVSGRITDLIRDQPYLRAFLPEPGTIDRLGDTNRALLIEKLSYGLTDFTTWVAQGFIILVLVIFMLIESEMLSAKLIRFFARNGTEAAAAGTVLSLITHKIRAYLIARTLINAGLGIVIALALWALNVQFALTLGLVAAVTNFVPYIGQLIGGALPTLMVLGQTGSIGPALVVAGDLPGGRRHRGLRRHAAGDGPIARLERDDGLARVPVLGIPLGPARPGSGHADHRQPESRVSDDPRAESLGRADVG